MSIYQKEKKDVVSKNRYLSWSDRQLIDSASELMEKIAHLLDQIRDAREISDNYFYEIERRNHLKREAR